MKGGLEKGLEPRDVLSDQKLYEMIIAGNEGGLEYCVEKSMASGRRELLKESLFNPRDFNLRQILHYHNYGVSLCGIKV